MKQHWEQAAEEFVSTTFLQLEATSVLRNQVFRQNLTQDEGEEAIETFRALPIRYYPMERFLGPAWDVAKRVNAPRLHDMIYIALAEAISCDLWTADRRLVRLLAPHSPLANWIGDVDI